MYGLTVLDGDSSLYLDIPLRCGLSITWPLFRRGFSVFIHGTYIFCKYFQIKVFEDSDHGSADFRSVSLILLLISLLIRIRNWIGSGDRWTGAGITCSFYSSLDFFLFLVSGAVTEEGSRRETALIGNDLSCFCSFSSSFCSSSFKFQVPLRKELPLPRTYTR